MLMVITLISQLKLVVLFWVIIYIHIFIYLFIFKYNSFFLLVYTVGIEIGSGRKIYYVIVYLISILSFSYILTKDDEDKLDEVITEGAF